MTDKSLPGEDFSNLCGIAVLMQPVWMKIINGYLI